MLGRYELRQVLGSGGAGTVHEAWDTVLARRVAIKVVQLAGATPAEAQESLARFRREAQVASQMAHPGVVNIYDYGERDGAAVIVMELVNGETLRSLLDREKRPPLPRVVAIMRDMLLALDHCHRHGIVHRDIKPGNVLLPQDGGLKLTDFGIVRVEDSDLTLDGTQMGTPGYMSPEQFTARQPVDSRTDIWSSGVVLYEMLTGKRPFGGGNMTAVMHRVLNDTPEPPSRAVADLSPAFDAVVSRALDKDPAKRFPSAAAFAEALQAALQAAQPARVAPPPRQRVPWLAISFIVVAVLAAGGGAGWFWLRGASPPGPLPNTNPPQHAGVQTPTVAPNAPQPPIAQPDATDHGTASHDAPSPPAKTDDTTHVAVAPILPPPAQTPSLAEDIAGLPCSTVRASGQSTPALTVLRGIIGDGEPKAALDAIMARLPADAVRSEVQTFPNRALSCRLALLARSIAVDHTKTAARIRPVDGRTRLVDNENILLQLRMPDFDGEVRLDDLDSNGEVAHLMELNVPTLPHYRAGETVGLGPNGDPLVGHVSEPFGTDIVVAIVSSEPLFMARRPDAEAGQAYLDALETAAADLRRRGGHVAADAIVLTTSRR